MVVPGRLKANDHGTIEAGQPFQEAVVLRPAVQHGQSDTTCLTGDLDQHVVARLRNIDGYQN